jgi:hypothetical protein
VHGVNDGTSPHSSGPWATAVRLGARDLMVTVPESLARQTRAEFRDSLSLGLQPTCRPAGKEPR